MSWCEGCETEFKGESPTYPRLCPSCFNKKHWTMECEFCKKPLTQTQYDKGYCYRGLERKRCNGIELEKSRRETELRTKKYVRQWKAFGKYWETKDETYWDDKED